MLAKETTLSQKYELKYVSYYLLSFLENIIKNRIQSVLLLL